jgi:hypothetical protein
MSMSNNGGSHEYSIDHRHYTFGTVGVRLYRTSRPWVADQYSSGHSRYLYHYLVAQESI